MTMRFPVTGGRASERRALDQALAHRMLRAIWYENFGPGPKLIDETIEPGEWRLVPMSTNPQEPDPFGQGRLPDQLWSCANCLWSHMDLSAEKGPDINGEGLIYTRRCHFNAPEVSCRDLMMGSDLDMEQSGVLAWSLFGGLLGATMTKDSPGHSGTNCLKVVNGLAPSAAYQGLFSDAYMSYMTPPPRFRVTGWVASDGSSLPSISIKANSGATVYGTKAITVPTAGLWQFLDLGNVAVPFGGLGSVILSLDVHGALGAPGDSAKFDDVRIELIDDTWALFNQVKDLDWCSHYRKAFVVEKDLEPVPIPGPTPFDCDGSCIHYKIDDQGTEKWTDDNGLAIVGPPGEPLRWQDPPRHVLIEGRPRFRAILPPFTRLYLVQLAKLQDVRP